MEKLAPTLREIEKSGVKVLIKGEAKENQKTIRDMAKGWDYCNIFNIYYIGLDV